MFNYQSTTSQGSRWQLNFNCRCFCLRCKRRGNSIYVYVIMWQDHSLLKILKPAVARGLGLAESRQNVAEFSGRWENFMQFELMKTNLLKESVQKKHFTPKNYAINIKLILLSVIATNPNLEASILAFKVIYSCIKSCIWLNKTRINIMLIFSMSKER
jgi:hypothetical protein